VTKELAATPALPSRYCSKASTQLLGSTRREPAAVPVFSEEREFNRAVATALHCVILWYHTGICDSSGGAHLDEVSQKNTERRGATYTNDQRVVGSGR
jgi:hypothetical protein